MYVKTYEEAWQIEQQAPKTPQEAGEKLARWSKALAETVGIPYEEAWQRVTHTRALTGWVEMYAGAPRTRAYQQATPPVRRVPTSKTVLEWLRAYDLEEFEAQIPFAPEEVWQGLEMWMRDFIKMNGGR
jgi:hypothetical protein